MQEPAEELKMQTTGLQSLAAALLQRRLGKGEQCADWQTTRLSDECATPTPPPPSPSIESLPVSAIATCGQLAWRVLIDFSAADGGLVARVLHGT